MEYNIAMARGWESKSVEQQIDDAGTESKGASSRYLSPEEAAVQKRREGLQLQRSHVLQEIASARNPRYRELLKEKLRHIEEQLSHEEPA